MFQIDKTFKPPKVREWLQLVLSDQIEDERDTNKGTSKLLEIIGTVKLNGEDALNAEKKFMDSKIR